MQKFSYNVTDKSGNGQSGISVTVKKDGVATTIYSDNGVTTTTNPVISSSDGSFSFYAPSGVYTLSVTDASDSTVYLWDSSAVISVNVRDFGALGDGSTDTDDILAETTKIQAAIDAAIALVGNTVQQPHGEVYFPGASVYLTNSLTTSKHITLRGDGRTSTYLKLAAGVTTPHVTVTGENLSLSVDDIIHAPIYGIGMLGNRTDTTPNNAHGIYCPDTAWSIGTQYSPSLVLRDVSIEGYSGSGIWTGVNRNWAIFDGVISRYNNRDGWTSYGYDHLVSKCSFGENVNYGVRSVAGGSSKLIACTVFGNMSGIVLDSATNNTWQVIGCDIDDNLQYGFYAGGAGAADCHILVGNKFTNNSTTAANTYSDIYLDGIEGAIVVGNHFQYGAQAVKYLIEFVNGAKAQWAGNSMPGATAPYGTAITNDFSALLSTQGAIGYAAGFGGTVTQLTSKSTAVTLNRPTGQITMDNAALAAATVVTFTLTNSCIAAGDRLILSHDSAGTPGAYTLNAQCAAGSASINVRNATAGSLGQPIVLGFTLVKGATT